MSNECNESEVKSIKQFLNSYDCGKSVDNCNKESKESPTQDTDGFNTSDSIQASVVMRNKSTTDSCVFSDHIISPNDVECEVFDWLFYHLEYKKCPYSLAIALAVIVSRKLGLGETASHESQALSNTDNSKPALSSNELYSQSLEYLTEYINHWKENPEIAVEIAKEYSSKSFLSSVNAIKNTRRKMEDRHVILHDLNKALNLKVSKQYSYYAIFDGHAGVDAASYSSAHLHHNLVKSQAFLDGDITGAFKESFSVTDLHYLERSAREGKKSGSTALCALLEGKSKIYIAWLGDSQAILVKNGKPIDIMIPHKPEREEERKRIEDLGGFVAYVDTWRVNGTLAVSRAIGDPEHKPFISSEPDVMEIVLDSDDDFLILACDGLWDQLTPEEATTLVYQYICENENENTQEIGENVASYLSKIAKEEGSSDNITTIVLFFKDISELMATPFTPLTPRDRALTSEMQQNGQLNGMNSSHFQFSDSQYEYMQTTANPFDSSLAHSMSWDTPSPFEDTMNNAKLNIEVSESMNSQNTNNSNDMSNPFDECTQQTPDNHNTVGINNENTVECNADMQSTEFNIESLSREQMTNPFETITDNVTNYSNESYSQSLSLTDNSIATALQTDNYFIGENVSDFSTSFPLSQTDKLDPDLCSTPLQSSQQLIVDPFNTILQENTVSEPIMDFSTDGSEEFCSFRQNDSESNINGLQNIQKKQESNSASNESNSASNESNSASNELNSVSNELNSVSNEMNFDSNEINSVSNEMNSISNEMNSISNEMNSISNEMNSVPNEMNLEVETIEKTHSTNETFGNSDIEENTSVDRSSWQTALNESLITTETKINNEVNYNFNDGMTNVFESPDERTVIFNQNQEFQDFSSGNESVDSIVYEKVNLDFDSVPKTNEIEELIVKTDNVMIEENLIPDDKNLFISETVPPQPEDNPQSLCIDSNFDVIESQILDSKPEIEESLMFQNVLPESEVNSSEIVELEQDLPVVSEDISYEPTKSSETVSTEADENLLMENIESISTQIITNTVESNVSEASISTTIESNSAENSLQTIEGEYIALENTDSKSEENSSKSMNVIENDLLLENIEQNSNENFSLSEESKPKESLLSDSVESKPTEIESDIVESKPEESLQLNNLETIPSDNSSELLVSHQKESLIVESVEPEKPKDESPLDLTLSSKTTPQPTKTVPSKTLNKTSSLSKTSSTSATNRAIANKTKPLPSEKLATKPSGTLRPKTTPLPASNGVSRPTVRTTTSTTALKPSSTSKSSRPLESRVSASRLTTTSGLTKPLTSAPRTLAAPKASDTKVSSAKTLPSKPTTASRTITATTGRALSGSRTTTSSAATTTKSSTSTTTKSSTSTNVSAVPRRTATQSATSAPNARPKTSPNLASSSSSKLKANAVNEKPASARPQASTIKSVTSRIDTGRSLTASNKTSVNNKVVAKSSTLQSNAGVKPISLKGENKASAVPKTNSMARTSNGFSSRVNKHNNPLNVAKPLKQELEDADLLSQPMKFSPTETKRSEILDSETFSSPDMAEKAFLMSKSDSFGLSLSFEASPIENNE